MKELTVKNLYSTTLDGENMILKFIVGDKEIFVTTPTPEGSWDDEFYFEDEENVRKAVEAGAIEN